MQQHLLSRACILHESPLMDVNEKDTRSDIPNANALSLQQLIQLYPYPTIVILNDALDLLLLNISNHWHSWFLPAASMNAWTSFGETTHSM